MEKPNSLAVQLGAFDTIIRALLINISDEQFNGFKYDLFYMLEEIEKMNQHPQITEQLKASKELAIILTQGVQQARSAK